MLNKNELPFGAGVGAEGAEKPRPYVRVLDGRHQPVRGLWMRGDRYYARLTVLLASGAKSERRISLKAATLTEAKTEMATLVLRRGNNSLQLSQSLAGTPLLSEHVETYIAAHLHLKRLTTQKSERQHLTRHCEYFAGVPLNRVTKSGVLAFRASKLADGWSGRTANLSLIVLRNVFRHAIDTGLVATSPVDGIRPVRHVAKKRSLVTPAMFETLCATAVEHLNNGQILSDYIKLMCFCGARRSETLRLKWSDVDFAQSQLVIGSDGMTKNHSSRVVDFNTHLRSHLLAMQSRRTDSEYLFPTVRSACRPLNTLVESLKLARKKSGLQTICFHDCRHHFISFCVMSGIDFMTIAKWAGHQDGGVLIGRVYGHLSDTHAKAQAKKVVFQPALVAA